MSHVGYDLEKGDHLVLTQVFGPGGRAKSVLVSVSKTDPLKLSTRIREAAEKMIQELDGEGD